MTILGGVMYVPAAFIGIFLHYWRTACSNSPKTWNAMMDVVYCKNVGILLLWIIQIDLESFVWASDLHKRHKGLKSPSSVNVMIHLR